MGARSKRRARRRAGAASRVDVGFDVRKGHQSVWTGCLGALYVLALFWGYAVYRVFELPGGGPPVAELFSYLPAGLRFRDVSRDFFDILALVGLLFQLMATWELLAGPRAALTRGALGAVAAASAVAVWTCPPGLHRLGGIVLSSAEIVLAASAVAFLVVGALGWHLQGRAADASFPAPRRPWREALRAGLVRWLSLELLVTAAWLLYVTSPYYLRSSDPPFEPWRITVTMLWSAFTVLGLPYAVWTARVRRRRLHDFLDPGLLLFLVSRSLWLAVARGRRRALRLLRNRRVRSALLDLLVKAFFLPLMVSFLFLEAGNFMNHMVQLVQLTGADPERLSLLGLLDLAVFGSASLPAQSDLLFKVRYGILRDSLFVMDVSVGLVGYACAFWWLGNKSKSVEPTFGGWLVALACYPPLTVVTTTLLPFGIPPGPTWKVFGMPDVQNALLLVALAGNAIYVWSTLAFGLRFSNLTNRGIITQGPYRWVRHPAYTAKVVAWWCETVPVFGSVLQLVFFLGWGVLYYLRAMTEERHLRRDPAYRKYCDAVRYRFVPGVL